MDSAIGFIAYFLLFHKGISFLQNMKLFYAFLDILSNKSNLIFIRLESLVFLYTFVAQ
jgi:hypothetical protein